MNNLYRQRKNAQNRDTNDNLIPARIGATLNGVNVIPVPGMPAWVNVTLMKGDQPGSPSTAICHKVSPRWWLPVLMSVNKDGSYYIERTDPNRINAFNSGSTAGILNSDDVGPHTHSNGSLTDPVPNARLADGRVVFRNDGPFTLYVTPFFYTDISGVRTYWGGGTINISTALSTVSGEQQWVEMDMDITNHIPIATAGPASPISISLGLDDLLDISVGGNLPLAAIIIVFNTPISNQNQIIDCSYVKQQASGGGSSSPLTTKGDLWGFDTGDARVPSSGATDGDVLTKDATQSLGVKWATPTGGGGGSSIVVATKSYQQRTILWDKTLSSSGTFDTNNSDDFGNSGNLDQTYDHLEIIGYLRALTGSVARITLNNDTTDANYNNTQLYWGTSSANSDGSDRQVAYVAYASSDANAFSSFLSFINDYTSAHFKSYLNRSNQPAPSNGQYGNTWTTIWKSTSAINRVAMDTAGGVFDVGSRLQIVGVKTETLVTGVTGAGTVSATQSATATIANTTAETSLVGTVLGSMTYAANALNSVGRTLRFKMWGVLSDLGITPGNITIKFKLGSTVIVSSGAVALIAGLTAAVWELDVLLTCQSTGGSGTVYGQGTFKVISSLAYTVESLNLVSQPVTVDLTTSQLADATVQFSVASASNTITSTNSATEVLN